MIDGSAQVMLGFFIPCYLLAWFAKALVNTSSNSDTYNSYSTLTSFMV